MKRIIVCLLLITLCGSLLSGIVAAAGNRVLNVSTVSGQPGETVDLAVNIVNNPGIAAFNFKLYFDNTALCPVSISPGAQFAGITSNVSGGGDFSGLEYVSATWYKLSNVTTDGVLFTVRFRILSNTSGYSPVSLFYEAGDLGNISLERLNLSVSNGGVSILNGATLYVKTDTYTSSDEFTADVMVANNPGINKFNIRLGFDRRKLIPLEIVKGALVTNGSFTFLPFDALSDYVTVEWTDTSNMIGNGVAFSVRFKEQPGSRSCTDLNVSYPKAGITNQENNSIVFNTAKTTVTLSQPAPIEIFMLSNHLQTANGMVSGTATMNIVNNTAATEQHGVLTCKYGEADIFKSCAISDKQLHPSGNLYTILGSTVQTSTYIKTFIWDMSTLAPVAEVQILYVR